MIILVTCISLLGLSIGVIIALVILIKIQLKKINVYEKEITDADDLIIVIRENIMKSLTTMREIDKQGVFSSRELETGLFESDDMVGQIFKELTQVVEDLNTKIETLNEKK